GDRRHRSCREAVRELILFGIYPAVKVSRINPIDARRHEQGTSRNGRTPARTPGADAGIRARLYARRIRARMATAAMPPAVSSIEKGSGVPTVTVSIAM